MESLCKREGPLAGDSVQGHAEIALNASRLNVEPTPAATVVTTAEVTTCAMVVAASTVTPMSTSFFTWADTGEM